ncbi:MAG: hypothetical protein JWQ09_5691, partial [Segetibacter sp.]|nr:hypothetical protein [Segetibacter sp.]
MKQGVFWESISEKQVIIFIALLAIAITVQGYLASQGNVYTHYNNFVIFKSSFGHLIHNQNLYIYYPKEYFDVYKYTPTFSLFMGLFYYLPDIIGLALFNVLNTALFIVAILKLKLPKHSLKFVFLFLALEFGISLTWTQTNIVVAALIILAFTSLEEKKPLLASLFIVLTFYIKIFGIVAVVLALFYPQKLRFILYMVMWGLLFALLPLIVVSKSELLQQYHNWFDLLKMDHNISYGVSFIGWIHSWFNIEISKIGTVAIAAIIFCIPLLKVNCYKLYSFRLQILASLLLWVVIFNHKGESPTYIIAMAGVAIWYFSQPPNTVNRILLWLALICTSFTSTDLITP